MAVARQSAIRSPGSVALLRPVACQGETNLPGSHAGLPSLRSSAEMQHPLALRYFGTRIS